MRTKYFTVVFQLSLLTLLCAAPGLAQGTSSEGVKDLKEDIEGNPFKGDGNAKLTLIEFTDYQ